jgi:hypothetical protein
MKRNAINAEHHQLQQALKFVTTRRAAVLLGISEEELRRISHESGFGRTEMAGGEEDTFTYEERRSCGFREYGSLKFAAAAPLPPPARTAQPASKWRSYRGCHRKF